MSLCRGYRIGINFNKLNKELGMLKAKQENTAQNKKDESNEKKLLVKCTAAQFATIIEMLMDRDYIQKSNNAEGTARILLRSFEFENNPQVSVESLGKKLFKEKSAINATDYAEIWNGKLPLRKYLKGTKE